MVREVYGVHLSGQEKGLLKKMIRTGRSSARAVTNSHRPIAYRRSWSWQLLPLRQAPWPSSDGR